MDRKKLIEMFGAKSKELKTECSLKSKKDQDYVKKPVDNPDQKNLFVHAPSMVRITAGDKIAGTGVFRQKNHKVNISRKVKLLIATFIGATLLATVTVAVPLWQAGRVPEDKNFAKVLSESAKLKLGYFGNVTHVLPLIGIQKGIYGRNMGTTKLIPQVFNAGPSAVEALNAGAIDAAYLGPNPAINSFAKSHGDSIRIVSGAASGGAELVTKANIHRASDLKGKVLASPQLGGTQDVALRSWLAKNNLKVQTNGGSDVTINPTGNSQTLKLFQQGKIDGAWLPEPWASRLIIEAGARVLVDEKSLHKEGKFPTTVLVVNKTYLERYPRTVANLIKGELETEDWIKAHSGDLGQTVNDSLVSAVGSGLNPNVIQRSLDNLSFTSDPIASSFEELVNDGRDAGVSDTVDISGIFDLRILNQILTARGDAPISAGGLGAE